MAKKEVKTERRKSIKEIMEDIIDKEELERRKKKASSSATEVKEEKKEEKPKQWFQLPMEREKFSIHVKDKKYYLHYSEWSRDVYAGAYSKVEECQQLIEDYVKVTNSKNILERHIPNIHSVIIEEDLPLWQTK